MHDMVHEIHSCRLQKLDELDAAHVGCGSLASHAIIVCAPLHACRHILARTCSDRKGWKTGEKKLSIANAKTLVSTACGNNGQHIFTITAISNLISNLVG